MTTEVKRNPQSTRPSALPGEQRRRRRGIFFWLGRAVLVLLLLLIVLIPVVWYLAPPFLIRQAQQWYSEQGDGYQLAVGKLDLSFWEGQLLLNDLVFTHPGKEGGSSELQELIIDLDTGLAVKGIVAITRLEMGGLKLRAEQTSRGMEVLGLHIAATDTVNSASSNGQTPQGLAEQLAALPDIRLNGVKLSNLQLGWQQPAGSDSALPRRLRLTLDQLSLDGLNTRQPDPLQLAISLRVRALDLEKPEVLTLNSPLTMTFKGKVDDWADENRRLRGDFNLKGLDLTLRQQAGIKLASLKLAGINATVTEQSLGALVLDNLLVNETLGLASTASGQSLPTTAAVDTAVIDSREGNAGKASAEVAMSVQAPLSAVSGEDVHVAPEASKLPAASSPAAVDKKADPVVVTLLTLGRYQVPRIEYRDHHLSTGVQEISDLSVSSGLQDGYLVGASWLGQLLKPDDNTTASAIVTDAADTDSQNADEATASAEVQHNTGNSATHNKTDDSPLEIDLAGIKASSLLLNWQQAGLHVNILVPDSEVGEINSESVDPLLLNGNLQVQSLLVGAPLATPVALQQPLGFSWKGEVRDWRRNPELSGDVVFSSLSVLLDEYIPVVADQIRIDGIKADRAVQEVGQLLVVGLAVREQPPKGSDELVGPTLMSVEEYRVPSVYFDGQTLTTGVQEFASARIRLVRDKTGNILLVPQRPDGQVVMSVKDPQAVSKEIPLQFRIGGIRQKDGNRSLVFWHDQAVKPDVRSEISIQALEVGVVDNKSLFASSRDASLPVDVSMTFGFDEFNSIVVNSRLALVGGEPDGKVSMKMSQLNLVPLSPYIINAIGYRVQKGMLDISSDIALERGMMNGNARIRLKNSLFEPEDKRIIANVSKQISMPVETALSVLKDDNNNLKLDLPISGPLNNPDVGLDDLLGQISRTAVKTATVYYLKQMFQPYGTLISLASYAGDKLMAIRLDPVRFEEGKAELTDDHRKYLSKVAEIMNKRTDLELQVCPFVSAAEVKTQGDKWPQLAEQRGRFVKAELASQKDEKGRSLSSRISICAAQKGDKAEVEMGF
jgi:hypothetical protein